MQINFSMKGGRRYAGSAAAALTAGAVSAVASAAQVPDPTVVQLGIVAFLGARLTQALSDRRGGR